MDFSFTDEQQQLRRTVREFAEAEIAPHVMEWDEASQFPSELIPKLAELGLLGVIFPEKYGGAGLGYIEYVIAIEELSRVDGSVGLIVAAHNSLCTNHIYKFGTEAQKQKYLAPLARGQEARLLVADRAGAGSDAGGTRTVAERAGDDWVLNGSKTFTTNGHYADVCVAMAVTDRGEDLARHFRVHRRKGYAGISRPGKKENKLGMRASDTSEVVFSDCRVPRGESAGRRGPGLRQQPAGARRRPHFHCGAGAGNGARAPATRPPATRKERKQFGKTIGEFQAIQFKLADMATEIDAARTAGLSRGVAGRSSHRRGRRDSLHARVQHGQAVCQRGRRARGQRSRAGFRRLRIHQGLSGGKVLSRRQSSAPSAKAPARFSAW